MGELLEILKEVNAHLLNIYKN